MKVDTEKTDWIENAGVQNLKGRSANADILRKQANTLLSITLFGGGAALYLAARNNQFSIAALIVSIYLFVVAALITFHCLMLRDYPAIWNEPRNLNQEGYELHELREFELSLIQERIEQAKKIIAVRSRWLNGLMFAVCATPIIGFIVWWFF